MDGGTLSILVLLGVVILAIFFNYFKIKFRRYVYEKFGNKSEKAKIPQTIYAYNKKSSTKESYPKFIFRSSVTFPYKLYFSNELFFDKTSKDYVIKIRILMVAIILLIAFRFVYFFIFGV